MRSSLPSRRCRREDPSCKQASRVTIYPIIQSLGPKDTDCISSKWNRTLISDWSGILVYPMLVIVIDVSWICRVLATFDSKSSSSTLIMTSIKSGFDQRQPCTSASHSVKLVGSVKGWNIPVARDTSSYSTVQTEINRKAASYTRDSRRVGSGSRLRAAGWVGAE